MHIRLIAPAMSHDDRVTRSESFTLPRLALQTLAGLTPEEHYVTIIDEAFGPDSGGPVPDLVGITVTTHVAYRAYKMADEYKLRGAQVVLGGIHPTVLPREALGHADAVVVGEAEKLWPQVVADAQDRKLRREYRQDSPVDLAGSRPARRDLYPRPRRWIPFGHCVETSRGCKYSCEFCSIAALPSRCYRTRPLSEVLRDLESIHNRSIFFVDDALGQNQRYARNLFTAMRPLHKLWIGQGTVSLAENPVLLADMKRSGCVGLLVGFESVQEGYRRSLPKISGMSISCEEAVRRFHDAGIAIMGSFVFGLDNDTPDVFDRTLEFAETCRLDAANPSVLHPYPGTRVYERFAVEGRLIEPRWWLLRFSETRVPFRPRGMSPDELLEGWIRFGRLFHAWGSILHRLRWISPLKRHPLSWVVCARLNTAQGRFFDCNFRNMPPSHASQPSSAVQ